ncbi:MAG: hypothetical protein IPK81_24175 [Rhodospirillales bacterium]|nr:MAG: hypothetical protein IPK81_24175 [Rhodospirillales bacterium]
MPAGFVAPPRFLGEGEVWSRHLGDATPLLSFAGAFPLFHTPGDVAVATTSPALLEGAHRAVAEAMAALLR